MTFLTLEHKAAILTAATLTLAIATAARAQAPILAYSARIGPNMENVAAVVTGADGSVYVAGRTKSIIASVDTSPRSSDLFVAKIDATGSSVQCSFAFGGSSEDFLIAMALGTDGSLFLTGYTYSADFPLTTVRSGNGTSFLVRVDPCAQRITYSTYLPEQVRPTAIAADGDTIWLASENTVLRYTSGVANPAAQATIDGTPNALTLSNGRIYATGARGAMQRRAFALRLDPALTKIEYDVTWGEGPVAEGTAVSIDRDGSAWIAGPAVTQGNAVGATYISPGLHVWPRSAAMLTRIASDGTVAFSRVIEPSSPDSSIEYRHPIAIGAGPDGRIWMASIGSSTLPRNVPQGFSINGIYLRSFNLTGQPAGEETIVPGLRSSGWAAVALGTGARIATATISPHFPCTSGSTDSGNPEGLSLVAFDLTEGNAPKIVADRELLEVDQIQIGDTVFIDGKTLRLNASDDTPISFTVATVPGVESITPYPASRYPAFRTSSNQGITPASIEVKSVEDPIDSAAILIVLAPGAQGIAAIPVKRRASSASFRRYLSNVLELPAAEDRVLETRLFVIWEIAPGLPVAVPFRLISDVSWLKIEQSDGIAPAEVRLFANARGLGTGQHTATISIQAGGMTVDTIRVTMSIGPLPRFTTVGGDIKVPAGKPFTHKFSILSTGAPLDFTIQTQFSGIQISPLTGSTPTEITVTFDPQNVPVGSRVPVAAFVTAGGSTTSLIFSYLIMPAQTISIPDSLSPPLASPGSLILYSAGTSRCEPSTTESLPWPTTLGGCTLRANGRPIPLKSIVESPVFSSSFIGEPIHAIMAQLPYDVEGSSVNMELEDRTGKKTSLLLAIQATTPVLRGILGYRFGDAILRKPGDELTLLVSGLGATDETAPVGDAPTSSIHAKARLEAFVGGRTARVVSAELSRTDPGVTEIRIEVPVIAADLHGLSLRVGSIELNIGRIVVTLQ